MTPMNVIFDFIITNSEYELRLRSAGKNGEIQLRMMYKKFILYSVLMFDEIINPDLTVSILDKMKWALERQAKEVCDEKERD